MYRPGDRFGEYEIVAPLRSGGMALLYVARRSGSAGFVRFVALKLIRPDLAGIGYVPALFAREALVLSRIDHPNVVRVESFGEAAGAQYLAMEYVHGVSLAELLAAARDTEQALPLALAVHVAAAIAEGLDAAHEVRDDGGALAGVVHRDVSPQNVVIAATGHVKVIDFGVARGRLDPLAEATAPSLLGKPRYMSPEQLDRRELDRRTDVYALAVVLLEMITGAPATATDPLSRLASARELPRADGDPRVLAALRDVLVHALATDREERTPTARALHDALLEACPDARRVGASALGAWIEKHAGSMLRADPRLALASRPPESTPAGDETLEPTVPPAAPPRSSRGARVIGVLVLALAASLLAVWLAGYEPSAPVSIDAIGDAGPPHVEAVDAAVPPPVLVDPVLAPIPSEAPRAHGHRRVGDTFDDLPLHDGPGF